MFEKGHPKYGGRKKGSTKERYRVRALVEEKLGMTLPEKILELSSKRGMDELSVLTSLMPYCYPRLNLNSNEEHESTSDESEQTEQVRLQAAQIIELIKMP